jgi:hypothetical protein
MPNVLYMGSYGDEVIMTAYNEIWKLADFRPTHQADTYGLTYQNVYKPIEYIVVNEKNEFREV